MIKKEGIDMIIGLVKEIKAQEYRVALTPAGTQALVAAGHEVLVEKGAGLGAGFLDKEYLEQGAQLLNKAEDVWNQAQMIVKVKEPLATEYKYLRKDLIVFTYLHLANEPELAQALIDSQSLGLAYETVQEANGSLPLLTPMSEVAGRMAVQQGAIYLEKTKGGKGKLIDGLPGVAPAHIVVVGGGIVGTGAIRRAVGLGARVTVLDIDVNRLRYLGEIFLGQIETLYSNPYNMAEAIKSADLVIGAVLIPGSRAPKLVTEEMVKNMEEGSVIVDVAIDQGGCVATIDKPTSHEEPTFVKHGVIHYAVPNIPGAVAQTSTLALTNASLAYIMQLANLGWKEAMKRNSALAKAANVIDGKVTNKQVADALDLEFTEIDSLL